MEGAYFVVAGTGSDSPLLEVSLQACPGTDERPFLAHAAMDAMDAARWAVPSHTLRALDRTTEHVAHGHIGPGGHRALLVHGGRAPADDVLAAFFADASELVVRLALLNPLSPADAPFPELAPAIRHIARRHFGTDA